MRLALLATATSIAIAGVMFACSNGPPQAEEADDGGTALPPKDESSNNDSTNNAANNGDNTPADPVDSDAAVGDGGVADATSSGVGTTEGDGGSRCLGTSIREAEPNNDAVSATKLPSTTNTFCGRLAAGDVDVFTFTMPENVNDFFFNIESFTGNGFKVEPAADGEPFNFNGNYPFKGGKPYTLKLSATGAAEYRLKITINQ